MPQHPAPTLRGLIAGRLPRRPRIAAWHPPTALAVAMFVLLVLHEVIYHLTLSPAAQDFPLTVLAEDRRVFVLSHGGLDMLLAAAVAVGLIAAIDLAQTRRGQP